MVASSGESKKFGATQAHEHAHIRLTLLLTLVTGPRRSLGLKLSDSVNLPHIGLILFITLTCRPSMV